MINLDDFLQEIQSNLALWCPGRQDTNDLARVAESVVEQKIRLLSVPPDAVKFLWMCLEKDPVKIHARFDITRTRDQSINREKQISDLSEQINLVFKQGADGTQIFIPYADLPNFVSDVQAIRDDLFFNKDLAIGLDINQIEPFDWADVFKWLKKIKATTLLLSAADDQPSADFVGRIYGLLDSWDHTFNGNLDFLFENDAMKIESTWRLVQKVRPEIASNVKFFIKR